MFNSNLAYEASAGSGKTFMLVVRYLSLLFKGADSSKILALTFTNKAANEMSERIISTLEELENRGELDEISKVTQLSRDEILKNRNRVLNEFLNANSKIMTIDSFFTQILRKFSLYASLMPDFSTFSSQHELKLLSRFLKEVDVANKTETLISLSLQSKKRLESIFELLDQFYEKRSELSHIRFEKQESWVFEQEAMKALEELKSIVDRCKEASSTVKKAVLAESFEQLSSKTWLERETLDYRTFSKCFSPEMDIYLAKIKNAVKAHHIAKEQNFFYSLNSLVELYEKSKKALYMDDGELSFSDVTILVHYLLKERVDSEFLYFRLDSQIEHMLLDEFQDTSVLQYEILKPLIEEIVSGNGIFDDGSFFFVGDVKQSIYRFRGGVSALFGAVKEECNTTTEQLLTNYRSQKEVIEFVNRAFSGRIKDYSSQLVRKEADKGYVEVIQSEEILEETLVQVKRLISLGADLNEIAILCATNGDGESIKEALVSQNVEVVTETTTKLINQRSVKAILEYLKYLYFQEDIYRRNFFALINQELRVMRKVDFTTTTLQDILIRVIEEYSLFSNDFHLIRFLNIVNKYSDIEALIFEYERLDVAAAASDLSGVRVLTVHKSKGLEYEHVIVMDRLKKAPPSRDSIIYEYDGIALQNIYLRIKGRDALDSSYANALAKEKQLVLEDSLNALYVAFTRARENLFIVKKPKDSLFDLLELPLGHTGELICTQKNIEMDSKDLKPLEYESFYYGTQSDLLSLEESGEEDFKSINFGLAMHYTLEMLDAFELSSLENAKDMMINKYGYILESAEVDEIVARVKNLLKSEEFIALIQGEIFKEQAMRYKKSLRYIDLLVKVEESSKESLFSETRYNVIDYKSGEAHSSHHVMQVKYYVNAVKEISGDEVDGYICYLLKNEIKLVRV